MYLSLMTLILFLSGASAMGAQILWIRYFSLVLGNHIHSFSWVTCLFVMGLALGAFISLRFFYNSRRKNLTNYLIVESLFAVTISLSFYSLIYFQEAFQSFLSTESFFYDGLVAIGVMSVPATFMGMSFPLLLYFDSGRTRNAKLYAVNTIGGAMGVALFGYIFLVELGYLNMMFLVPALSLINILLALILRNTELSAERSGEEEKSWADAAPLNSRSLQIFLAGASGLILFTLEVMWFRHLEMIIGNRAYVSTIILFAIILGLGLSAYISPALCARIGGRKLVRVCCYLSIVSLCACLVFMPEAFYILKEMREFNLTKFSFMVFSFLLPLLFLGCLFPSVIHSADRGESSGASKTILMLGGNSLLGICGSLLGSYFLIEAFGVNSILSMSVYLLCIISLSILLLEERKGVSKKWVVESGGVLVFIVLFPFITISSIRIAPQKDIVFQEQLPETHFTLLKRTQGYEMYAGNYRMISPSRSGDVDHTQKGLAFFPALYHEGEKEILSMGAGYGITLGSFLQLDTQRIDSVEILPSVYRVSPYFSKRNGKYYEDDRVNMIVDDGRQFMAQQNKKKYDIISANISSPYTVSGSYFLTREYYKEVKKRLEENGVYSQLVWGPNLREIIHTFASVFDHIKVMPGYSPRDVILIGGKNPLELKKPVDHYDKWWPGFRDYTNGESLKLGERVLDYMLNREPDFMISDHRADILFVNRGYLGSLWIY